MKPLNFLVILFLGFNYGLLAQQTFVPDDNFEQALIDLGHDNVLDNFVLTNNINTLISLEINELNISDLTGIEDFSALQYLYVRDNNLSSLNIQSLVNLFQLECSSNNLSNLDLSNNTTLYNLRAHSNQLTNIDFSNNLLITGIHVEFNQLTELNLSNQVDLQDLNCAANQIETIDLSNQAELRNLWCYSNPLEYLNVRNGNNHNVQFFNSEGNPNLTCIFVDDAAYSEANWEYVDSSSTFVETQEDCNSLLSTEDYDKNNWINLYPNPTNNIINLVLPKSNSVISIHIFNANGIMLMNQNQDANFIDISELSSGLYFIKIKTELGVITRKIIKM